MPVTPPPPSRSDLRTPPAPLHGDNYEPYAPRRSVRTAKKPQAHTETPPPSTIRYDNNTSDDRFETPASKKRQVAARHASFTFSPPLSAQSSPMKKTGRTPSTAAGRRNVSSALTLDSNATASATSGMPVDDSSSTPTKTSLHAPVVGPGMLPTPAKSPKKRASKTASTLGPTARVLFPTRPLTVEEAMPTPRKNRRTKKSGGFTLGGITDEQDTEDAEANIQIYTDSKERVPEVDLSDDNPFLSRPGQAEAAEESRRLSKRRKTGSGTSQEIEESLGRDDGIFVVFRGKKVFHKFDTSKNVDDDINGADAPDTGTRTSVKPRLLFPNKDQVRVRESRVQDIHIETSREADEEAITDVDEETRITLSQEVTAHQDMGDSEMTNAGDLDTEVAVDAPKSNAKNGAGSISFDSSPASGTRSATRASNGRKPGFGGSFDSSSVGSNEHMTRSKGRPFDNWSRTKGLSPSGTPALPGSGGSPLNVRKRSSGGAASSASNADGEAVSKRTRASASSV